MRGLAPAIRVMSRSEPPAACSGSCPSIARRPAWLSRTFASACGRWLVTATSRSCAPASIATGRHRGGDEAVDGAEQFRPRPRRRREEPGRALEQLGVRTPRPPRLGAADRMTADEAAVAGRRGDTALFVEPTSVTTQSSGRPRAPRARRAAARRRAPRRRRARRRRRPPRASPPAHGLALVRRPGARRDRGPSPHGRAGAARGERSGRADQARPDDGVVPEHEAASLASARRPGTPGRATGGRSGAGRRAIRTDVSSCSSSTPRSRRGTPSRPRP